MLISKQQAQLLYSALNNMTNLVNDQTEAIEQASFTAKDLSSQMKEASEAAKSWNNFFSTDGSVGIWMARVFLPPIGVLAGGLGLPPSAIRNGVLYVGGEPTLLINAPLELTFV
jgi:hypothetical protein